MLDSELASLKQLPLLPPDEVLERAEALRRRANECADLASDCLTEDAKRVLSAMAEELGERAAEKASNPTSGNRGKAEACLGRNKAADRLRWSQQRRITSSCRGTTS